MGEPATVPRINYCLLNHLL